MKAGRELDVLVAEKIFGLRFWAEKRGEYTLAVVSAVEPWTTSRQETWERQRPRYTEITGASADKIGFFGDGPKDYSSDIAAAWTVVEKMREKRWLFSLYAIHPVGFAAKFSQYDAEERYMTNREAEAAADTAALAICLAALKTVGVEI